MTSSRPMKGKCIVIAEVKKTVKKYKRFTINTFSSKQVICSFYL